VDSTFKPISIAIITLLDEDIEGSYILKSLRLQMVSLPLKLMSGSKRGISKSDITGTVRILEGNINFVKWLAPPF
jgi:hypothetical protein